MSEVIKSLLPTLARMTDAEKDELRALLGPEENAPELTQEEWEAAWAEEGERRYQRALATGDWGRPGDEVMRELKERFG